MYLDKAARTQQVRDDGAPGTALTTSDPNQPQTRVLFLGGSEGGAKTEVRRDLTSKEQGYIGIWGTHYRVPIEAEYGIRGDTSMINIGPLRSGRATQRLDGFAHIFLS